MSLQKSWLAFGCLGIFATVSCGSDFLPSGSVKSILQERCFSCHADGSNEGSFSFDELRESHDAQAIKEGWHQVLKKIQAGLMPPPEEEQLATEEIEALVGWIKYSAFDIDPADPDPGRITIRRLNQVEYRNTIRDLLGVDYDTSSNFPGDDTGHGFDNIGDVLSMSPLLLEKYFNAAQQIVQSVVPTVSGVVHVEKIDGDQFQLDNRGLAETIAAGIDSESSRAAGSRDRARPPPGTIELSYYEAAQAQAKLRVAHPGDYLLRLNLIARETYVDNEFDENKCEFTFSLDEETLLKQEFVRQGSKQYTFSFERSLMPGDYLLSAAVQPRSDKPQIRQLRLQITSVELIGPESEEYLDLPKHYRRFFPRDVPTGMSARRDYAKEILQPFATRAFRRPVDEDSLSRLVDLAESVYGDGSNSFESGIAKSMTAILASPRFLFREEAFAAESTGKYPFVDEFALASRLSYFLWSTMPDEELMGLARKGRLRKNLDEQLERMLADEKSQALAENFVGQWLRARALATIQINAPAVLAREPKVVDPEADVRRSRFFELFRKGSARTAAEVVEFERETEAFLRSFEGGASAELTSEIRTAMRLETELCFDHILKHNRSLLELIDSEYTFLNEALAAYYQIADLEPIRGEEMRLISLPKNSLRGGVLTQGTTLVVTSNPDRTSPVKRGLFILENLLGTPPAAPPPNIPALEDVESNSQERLSLRETLALHRANALCSSCHNQMDPLGLALENFNALGKFRTEELGQPVDAAGSLGPEQSFASVSELKQILVRKHGTEIYRCITEKLMTYALGRAVDYMDTHTVDQLVAELETNGGQARSLIYGIVRSNAFQKTRRPRAKLVRAP